MAAHRASLTVSRTTSISAIGRGIPVREGLQAVYKVYRDKSIKEGALFLAMFVVFMLNVSLVNNVSSAFHTGNLFTSQLVDQEMDMYSNWQKGLQDVSTFGDVYQWLTAILYPNLYQSDWVAASGVDPKTGYVVGDATGLPTVPDTNATMPAWGNYLLYGGVRLRQVRVSRDSCVSRRAVGGYSVPATVFDAAAMAGTGRSGAQGASTLQRHYAATPAVAPVAGAATGVTGAVTDGGPSASFDLSYALGCMNYWAMTGTCPNDADVSHMSATVMINPLPVANVSESEAATLVPVPVRLAGRVKCAMHNVTAEVAAAYYTSFNPLFNGSFEASTLATPGRPTRVLACLGRFDTLDGTCTAEYLDAVQQVAPFVGASGTVYYYTPYASQDPLFGMLGWGPSAGYGKGGYLVHLSNDAAYAAAVLNRLVWDHWIDKATRAITVDFNAWNAATSTGTAFRAVFELYATGYMTTYVRTYTYRVLGTDVGTNVLVYLVSAAFLAFWLYFITKECQRAYYSFHLWAYVSSFRNLYVITLLALAGIYIWSWVSYVFVVNMYARLVAARAANTYVDLFNAAEGYQTMFTLSGLLGLAFFFKMFEYLGINKRMRTMWMTLYVARADLLAFLVGFLLLVYGFSFAGHFIFGYNSPGFHNPGSSLSTLLRFPLGDFDYNEQLYDTRAALAPWFFLAFLAMIFLVCLNVAIAILTEAFKTVHEATKSADRWKETATSIDEDVLFLVRIKVMVWTRPCLRWCRRKLRRPASARPGGSGAGRYSGGGSGGGGPDTPAAGAGGGSAGSGAGGGSDAPPASSSSGGGGGTPAGGEPAGSTVVPNPMAAAAAAGAGTGAASSAPAAPASGGIMPGPGRMAHSMRILKSMRSGGGSMFGRPPATAALPPAAAGHNDDAEDLETEREYDAYKAAAKFYAMVHRCTHAAKVHHNIDLLGYLQRLYENEADSDALYVGT